MHHCYRKPLVASIGSIVAAICVALSASAQAPPQAPAGQTAAPPAPRFPVNRVKPRVIATTDGEVDDMCSMVRFLMYANEFQVEGLIHSSSRFHWLGYTWSGVEWIDNQIGQYARVYDRLRQNADGYPKSEPGGAPPVNCRLGSKNARLNRLVRPERLAAARASPCLR